MISSRVCTGLSVSGLTSKSNVCLWAGPGQRIPSIIPRFFFFSFPPLCFLCSCKSPAAPNHSGIFLFSHFPMSTTCPRQGAHTPRARLCPLLVSLLPFPLFGMGTTRGRTFGRREKRQRQRKAVFEEDEGPGTCQGKRARGGGNHPLEISPKTRGKINLLSKKNRKKEPAHTSFPRIVSKLTTIKMRPPPA